jgi:thioredoxin reductase (NADPH)
MAIPSMQMSDDVDGSIPTLDANEIAFLDPLGQRQRVEIGRYLYKAGDTGYDFYVVLSGRVEILLDTDGDERLITTHGPGRFLGELNMLTGLRVFLSARVSEPGEVLAVPVETLRRILATEPELSDKILAAFMARRADLITGAAATTRVVGSRFSPETLQIREFLARTRLPYLWLDPDTDPQVESLLEEFQI